MVNYLIGTSGWHYDDWRKRFYPEKMPKTAWLEFYTRHFPTVELNNSFYRLPSEKAFTTWREDSRQDFLFAVKVSRFITHVKRLKGVEEALEKFLAGARFLGEKLGPLLYQFPPNMHRNDQLLESFLALLPPGLQHVFEFRHPSWLEDRVFHILREHSAGFCVFDMPDFTTPVVATTSFAYLRFHGSTGLYSSCYSEEELERWAGRIAELGRGLEAVYVYFNNDTEAFAVMNAQALERLLKPTPSR